MTVISNILSAEPLVAGFQAVVFDLDDTLYSEKEYVRSGFRQVAARFPEHPDAEAALWHFFEEKKPAIDCFLAQKGLPPAQKAPCLAAYRGQQPDIHLYPGVQNLLTRLAQHHRLGLITDGRPDGQRAKLRALGLEPLFDQIIITDELGGVDCRKPNPLAFRTMAAALGVPCEQMCYIGDNPQKDAAGAAAAGVSFILFQNPDGLYLDRRTRLFEQRGSNGS